MSLALLLAFGVGMFIFFVYKRTFSGVMYSSSFGVTLIALTMITTLVILAVTSNVVLSLGMVGALSIVRFRTAIKDPMDLLFLFWSIGTGIICGAGLYKVAIILAVLVTVGILVLDLLPVRISPYLLIINADTKEAEDKIIPIVKEAAGGYKLKSKNITAGGLDMILEVKAKNEKELLDRLSALKEVVSVSLLAHDGEVKG